jgi:hypothetical protein
MKTINYFQTIVLLLCIGTTALGQSSRCQWFRWIWYGSSKSKIIYGINLNLRIN